MPSSLLISETPHQVIPSLAAKIGLNETLFLQQLHWLIENNECHAYDGHRWWKQTNTQWLKRMPYFSEKTVKRTIAALKKQQLIVVESLTWKIEKIRGDRTSWYRVNYDEVVKISNIIEQEKDKESMRLAEAKTARAPKAAKYRLLSENNRQTLENNGKGQNDPMGSAPNLESGISAQNNPKPLGITGKGQNDPMAEGQKGPMTEGQKGPMIYKTYKKDLSSSSKPEQAQVVGDSFDLDVVMSWILKKMRSIYELSASDAIFIEASLDEYFKSATKPRKAQAFT